MLFLVMDMLPIARKAMQSGGPPEAELDMLRNTAKRFLMIAWAAMVLLGLSGVYLAWEHWASGPGCSSAKVAGS